MTSIGDTQVGAKTGVPDGREEWLTGRNDRPTANNVHLMAEDESSPEDVLQSQERNEGLAERVKRIEGLVKKLSVTDGKKGLLRSY